MDPYSEAYLKHFGVKSTRVDLRENRARLTQAKAKKRAELSRRIEHMQSEGNDYAYQNTLKDFMAESADLTDTTIVAKKYKPKLDRALVIDLEFDDYDEGIEVLKEVGLDHVVHNGVPEIVTGNYEIPSFVSGQQYSRDNRRPAPDIETAPNDELYHYGVQGMKWGIRRGRGILSTASANAKGNLERMSGNRNKRHKIVKDVAAKAGDNAKANLTRMAGNRDKRHEAVKTVSKNVTTKAASNAKANVERMSGNRDKRHEVAKALSQQAASNAKGNMARMAGNRNRRHDAIKKLVTKPGAATDKTLQSKGKKSIPSRVLKATTKTVKDTSKIVGKSVWNQALHPGLYYKNMIKVTMKHPTALILLRPTHVKMVNDLVARDLG